MLPLSQLLEHLEQFAPLHLAAEWDNVGLLLGDRAATVQRVLTCLTLTPPVVAEAIARQAQLIVTHHPILFRAVKRLTTSNAEGRMLLDLIRAGIAVYSPHTAFDNTRGGINDTLAARLGLTAVAALRNEPGTRLCKIVVFAPDADLDKVSTAMFEAGAGYIGEYRECSFRLPGTGTFFGSEQTNPTVGVKGRREQVQEWRLEVVCPETTTERVVSAMRRAHSYEEPVYDVYPLRPAPSATGTGRIGQLPAPLALSDFARLVQQQLRCGPVQVIGELARPVQRVAIVCGAGGELFGDAVRARADVFLTGEMRFHDYLAGQQQNIALCLPGHYATERFALEELATQLRTRFPALDVFASNEERDPVQWIGEPS